MFSKKKFWGYLFLMSILILAGFQGGASPLERTPLQQQAEDAETYYRWGNYYLIEGDYDKAIEAYSRAIDLDPAYVSAYFGRGHAYHLASSYNAAIADYEQVIKLDPQYAVAYNNLAYLYADALEENLLQATDLALKALELEGDGQNRAIYLDTLGWVYFKRGMLDDAFSILQQAIELQPNQPEIVEHLNTVAAARQASPGGGAVYQINVDGLGHVEGPLPVIFYALTEPSGEDIYPLGEGAYSLFGLYDSGSTKVRISNMFPPNWKGGPNWEHSDTEYLKLAGFSTVNLRLNGLNMRQPNGSIPIGSPSSANGPQIEVGNITVKPEEVNVSLIGAPVINQIVAQIDYANMVTDSRTGVKGPYTDFFWPGDPEIPAPNVKLNLEPVGEPVSTDAATPGSRYWLRNVTFQQGSNMVSDQPGGFNFLFDTGTTLTLINDRVAATLGLPFSAGSFNCFGGTNNGYIIASVVMRGEGGFYQINHAAVCWQANKISRGSDAVIGSNFFDQVQIVLDGPGNSLGINGPGQYTGGPQESPPSPGDAAAAVCEGVAVAGFCWYLGGDSAPCDSVCVAHGGYDEATRMYAGSDGSSDKCREVLQALQLPIDNFFETTQGGIGCFVIQNTSGNYFGYWDKQPTTASATTPTPGRNRVCACGTQGGQGSVFEYAVDDEAEGQAPDLRRLAISYNGNTVVITLDFYADQVIRDEGNFIYLSGLNQDMIRFSATAFTLARDSDANGHFEQTLYSGSVANLSPSSIRLTLPAQYLPDISQKTVWAYLMSSQDRSLDLVLQ